MIAHVIYFLPKGDLLTQTPNMVRDYDSGIPTFPANIIKMFISS